MSTACLKTVLSLSILLIVIASVAGSQVIAWMAAYFFVGQVINPGSVVLGLITSLPAAVGWIVLIFYILQRFEVRPNEPEVEWNPETLPEITPEIEVKRSERIITIAFETILIAVLALFPDRMGAFIIQPPSPSRPSDFAEGFAPPFHTVGKNRTMQGREEEQCNVLKTSVLERGG